MWEGGPPSDGRELLHFWTLNCAIWCIPREEIRSEMNGDNIRLRMTLKINVSVCH